MLILNDTNYFNGTIKPLDNEGATVPGGRLDVVLDGVAKSYQIDAAGKCTPEILSGKSYTWEVYNVEGILVGVYDPVSLAENFAGADGKIEEEKAERIAADEALQKQVDAKADAASLSDEVSRANAQERVLQKQINAINNRNQDAEFETKADAKSKTETYGLLMRENGKNTLQFYRPSLG